MKSEHEVMEEYIDYIGDREFIETLTLEEQVLFKCQIKDTLSFTLFALRNRIAEFINILFERK